MSKRAYIFYLLVLIIGFGIAYVSGIRFGTNNNVNKYTENKSINTNSLTNENKTHNTDTTTIDSKILVVYYSATGNIEDARNIELVSATVENWDEYDRVFIGYPLWWQYCLASK